MKNFIYGVVLTFVFAYTYDFLFPETNNQESE